MNLSSIIATIALAAAQMSPIDSWPMYQFSASRNAVFAAPDWNVSWTADIGSQNNGGLSVVGTTVYVQSFAHKVFAFDALTGRKIWEREVDDVAMSTTVAQQDLVYAGTGTGATLQDDGTTFIIGRPQGNAVYGIDASGGTTRWRFNTIGNDMPSAVLYRSGARTLLIFHSGDGRIRALDAATGTLQWQATAPGTVTMASLAESDGVIYGVSGASLVFALDAYHRHAQKTATFTKWTFALRADDGQFLWLSPHGYADGSPTVGGGRVFVEEMVYPKDVTWLHGPYMNRIVYYPDLGVTPLTSRVVALDARSGEVAWSYESAPGLASFRGSNIGAVAGMYDHGILYQSLPYARRLAAFDAATGKIMWMVTTHDPVKMGAVLKDGLLYFGDNGGRFYIVDAHSGAVKQSIQFPGVFGCSPPVIVGRTLFVTNGSTLYAVRLSDVQRGLLPASVKG